jgi:hypothetical protein
VDGGDSQIQICVIKKIEAYFQIPEKRRRAGAVQDASRQLNADSQRASVLDCGSPLPLSHGKAKITSKK